MKIIRSNSVDYIPTSHDDPNDPGSLKKVLARAQDLIPGQIMMINWSKIPVGRAFDAHYHEDLQEVFIIISGEAEISVEQEIDKLFSGDLVIIPSRAVHLMKNVGTTDLEYIALGISASQTGKTVTV